MSYGNGIQPFNISTGVTDEPFEYTWNLEWPAGAPFLMTMTDESGWGSAPVSDIISAFGAATSRSGEADDS